MEKMEFSGKQRAEAMQYRWTKRADVWKTEALVLILLSFWDGARKRKLVYPLAIAFTSVTSIIVVLATGGFMTIPGLTSFLMDSIPAIVRELLWVGPALVGILLGWFLSPAPSAEAV